MLCYYASHEVKNQCTIAKRTSQTKWTDVKYPNGKWHQALQTEQTHPTQHTTRTPPPPPPPTVKLMPKQQTTSTKLKRCKYKNL